MKKALIIIFSIFLKFSLFAQVDQFESKSAIREEKEFKVEHVSRLIVFTESTITISNWLNGGQEALKLKIDSSVNKEYSLDGVCKWYYCISLKKDFINGYTKTIIIVPKSKDKLNVFTFANEVTVYTTEILISKD